MVSNERKAEIAERILEIAEEIRPLVDELHDIARELADGYHDAYIVDHLEILTRADHSFISRDPNLEGWSESLESGPDEGDADDEDDDEAE